MHASVATPTPASPARSHRLDWLVALALATLLSAGWAISSWSELGRLLLPDNDDMIRLAQVRDWIAGQGINDWTQYRMAPPAGVPMHWSRVNDFGLAAIIVALAPLLGQHMAELVAVILYPAMLFVCALFLAAQVGRMLWGAAGGPISAVLAALAFPGTTVFVPGRIDHHALQVVLVQLLILTLMRAPTLAAGVVAGGAASLSLIVGLETAPHVAVLLSVMAVLWVAHGAGERERLAGFAAALAAVTLGFLIFLRPSFWSASLCDAFTPASSTGMLAIAAAFGLLALLTPWLRQWRLRLVIGAVLGAVALGGTLAAFPSCISGPYGEVDPFLKTALLGNIVEANGILAFRDPARAISVAGLLAVGCVASLWALLRDPARWQVLLPSAAAILASALVTLAQLRGAYIGALLVPPVLAGVILAARGRTRLRLPSVLAAWVICVGITYLVVPAAIARMAGGGAGSRTSMTPQVACGAGDAFAQLDRLPAGTVMAPISIASYLIGATHHATVGAGYHRNNAGNIAMYRFFLATPDRARQVARDWKVDYVALCPGDFAEIGLPRSNPSSLAAQLARRRPPPWLHPLQLRNTPMRVWRVVH